MLDEKPGLGSHLRRHQLDACRSARRSEASHPGGTCRGRPALVQHADAGGDQPHPGRSFRLLFCPTTTAVANLAREGISKGVHRVGDVMYDVALYVGDRGARSSDVMAASWIVPRVRACHLPPRREHGRPGASERDRAGAGCDRARQYLWSCRFILAPAMLLEQAVYSPRWARRVGRAAFLPRHGGARAGRQSHRHRFGRRSKGSLFLRRSLRDHARRNRMGGNRRTRLQ